MTDELSLVFFGTGPVAAESLEALSQQFEIKLVITKPKPAYHKHPAPVEEMAKKKDLKLCFAGTTQEIDSQIEALKPASEVAAVIDFGVIISTKTIDYFQYGIINSHFSLLPRWRGADPITFTLLSGDQQTGISLMKIVKNLDEGPIIIQKVLPVEKKATQITLTRQLIDLSNETLLEYLPKYINGEVTPEPQPAENISYSRKITKKDGDIDWNKTAQHIEREIRAYAGWPKSRANINKIDCIILEADISNREIKPGKAEADKNKLLVGCSQGSLSIKKLQPAGKKPMSADEFIRGYIK